MSFYREQPIKVTRKAHACYGCDRRIEAGEPALYIAATDENNGGIWHGHYHHDCRAAEVALNDVMGFHPGDDWTLLLDVDPEDRPWLKDKFPAVAARLFGPVKPAA